MRVNRLVVQLSSAATAASYASTFILYREIPPESIQDIWQIFAARGYVREIKDFTYPSLSVNQNKQMSMKGKPSQSQTTKEAGGTPQFLIGTHCCPHLLYESLCKGIFSIQVSEDCILQCSCGIHSGLQQCGEIKG